MKRRENRSILLENVREGPIRHGIHVGRSALDLVEDEAGLMILIVHRIGSRVGRTPLGKVPFHGGAARLLEQLTRVLHAATDSIWIGIENGASSAVRVQKSLLDAVSVCSDEVSGDMIGNYILL